MTIRYIIFTYLAILGNEQIMLPHIVQTNFKIMVALSGIAIVQSLNDMTSHTLQQKQSQPFYCHQSVLYKILSDQSGGKH